MATYADYLVVERPSERRHELIDGIIVARAGGSDEHNALAARVTMSVGARLPPTCRPYSADQRFWIASTGRARYADGSVICGRPAHPAHNPQAVPEVCLDGDPLELQGLTSAIPVAEVYEGVLDEAGRSLLR